MNGETLVEEIAKSFGDLFGRKIEALQVSVDTISIPFITLHYMYV